jgi:hypothetical protein
VPRGPPPAGDFTPWQAYASLGLANATVANQLDLSYAQDRSNGFRAIVKAIRRFQDLNIHGQPELWTDSGEAGKVLQDVQREDAVERSIGQRRSFELADDVQDPGPSGAHMESVRVDSHHSAGLPRKGFEPREPFGWTAAD